MRLLALDTSTMVASVALVDRTSAGAVVLAHADSVVVAHSDNLLLLVDRVLAEAAAPRTANQLLPSIDAIAVGAGPGSFTGLRIAMATAKGLAFATGKPLHAVSSLAALAKGFAAATATGSLLVPVLDARREEVFAGFYAAEPGGLRGVAVERVLPPSALAEVVAGLAADFAAVLLVGDGVVAYPERLAAVGELHPEARQTPSAIAIAELAFAADPIDVLERGAPVYLRPSEAEVRFPDGNPGWRPRGPGSGEPSSGT